MKEGALLKTAKYLQDLAGTTEVDAVKAFAGDTPEAMGERIDEAVADAEADATITLTPTVDTEGLPWDARIHSSSRNVVKATGAWKLIRGVDAALVEQVKAELRAAVAPVAVAVVPATPAPSVEETTPPSTVVHDPSVVTPPAPPVDEVVAPVTAYPELMQAITKRAATGGLLPADVATACTNAGAAAVGVLDLPGLASEVGRPFIALVAEELRKLWATRG